MLRDAISSYRDALGLWSPLLTVHLFVRLVSAAVLIPAIGALLAVTLSFSDQSALTDQDIARFLLTPVGLVGALIICSLVLASLVIDVAVMTAVIRSEAKGPLATLRAAFGFLVPAMPRIIEFAGYLLLRVLLLAFPFLALAGGVAALLLRDFDINYYLTYRPPAFKLALGFGIFCLVALGLLLLERLTAWAIALHYRVFDLVPARQAFTLSQEKMHGKRRDLFFRVLVWLALRFVLASLLVTTVGFLLAEVPRLFDDHLRVFFLVTGFLLVIWMISNAFLSAISNGALADMLNDAFNRSLEHRPARDDVLAGQPGTGLFRAPLIAMGLAVISLLAGGMLSNRIGGVEDVEIIGHRGAAASRPENTMAAILKAVEDGADWVEIDVQETADGQVLVVHDSDFMKAAGVATKVWDVTMDEVAGIDIGSWFDPVYADERAPLLRDVLAQIKGRSKLIIELKYYGHDVDLENRVVALVEEAGMQDQIATMSLKYPAVQKMRALRPDWRVGVLAATAVGNLSGLDGDFLAVSAGRVSARLLARAEAAGKDVYAWTVNDEALMSRMISLGVDGLITDEPKLASEVIAYYKTLSTPERLMLRLGDTIGFAFDITPEEGGEI